MGTDRKSLHRGFLNASYVMVGIGLFSASAADPTVVSGIMLGLTVSSLAGSYLWRVLLRRRPISHFVATILALIGFLATGASALTWQGVLLPFLHFLSITQCIGLWQEKSTRQYPHLYMVSLVQVACGASISLELHFGILFLAYLLVGVWVLLLFHLYSQGDSDTRVVLQRRVAVPMGSVQTGQVWGAVWWGLPVIVVILMVLSVLFFVVLPRYRFRVLSLGGGPVSTGMAGFSQSIQLGGVGEIRDNAEPMLRVQLARKGRWIRGEDIALRWRGVALDAYSHGEWRMTKSRNIDLRLDVNQWSPPGRYQLGGWQRQFLSPEEVLALPPVPNQSRPSPADISQHIALESRGNRVLFSLYPPIYYDLPDGLRRVSIDLMSRTATFEGNPVRFSYVAYSLPQDETEEELERVCDRPQVFSRLMRRYYVDLPPYLHRDGRLPALAQEIVREANAAAPYERVRAVRLWLESHCKYTTRPGVVREGTSDDPILTFLFETRRGHCEYFATAQVLLVRALGYPARVVNGFRGGEWNELGMFYLVRQRDAHSWAEVFLYPVGWFEVDPSPRALADPRLHARGLSKYQVYLQHLYDNLVIQYSPHHLGLSSGILGNLLFDIESRLGEPAAGFEYGVSESGQALIGRIILIVGAFTLLVLLLLGVTRLIQYRPFRFWGGRRDPGAERSSVRFYENALRLLRRRGYHREASTTPAEFAQRVAGEAGPPWESFRRLTEIYYRARYAGTPLNDDENAEVRRLYAVLRDVPRATSSGPQAGGRQPANGHARTKSGVLATRGEDTTRLNNTPRGAAPHPIPRKEHTP